MKRFVFCSSALALLLTACGGNPQQLPVGISACRASSTAAQPFGVVATVESKADRPISQLDMTITFYQDFRYRTFEGSARLPQELDPGQKRDVQFQISGSRGAQPRGQAMRCFVTRIGYLDGTSQTVRPAQY